MQPNNGVCGGRAFDQIKLQVEITHFRAAYPRVGDSPARPLHAGLGFVTKYDQSADYIAANPSMIFEQPPLLK